MGMAQGNWWKITTEFGKVRKDYTEHKTLCEDDRNMKGMRVRRGRPATSSILMVVKMFQ